MTTLRTTHEGWFNGIISDAPPAESRPVPWTLTDILIGIAANVGFAVLLYRIADMLGLLFSPEHGTVTGILVRLGYHILGFLAVLLIVRWRGGTASDLGFRPIPSQDLHLILLGFAGMLGIIYGYQAITNGLGLAFLRPVSNAPVEAFAGDWAVGILILRSVFFTPVTEEVLVRGFVFGGFRRSMPLWLAITRSGMFFGVVHLSTGLLIPYSLIGMLLAYLYARTGSIYTCIAVHALFNAFSLIIAAGLTTG
jgi:membrane protease YdiL (CAAX protease family)